MDSINSDDGVKPVIAMRSSTSRDWQHMIHEAVTPTSGHLLDADTFLEAGGLSIKLAMSSVNKLLKKHLKVGITVIRHHLQRVPQDTENVFANNDGVEVDDTSFPYYAHKHGDIMLGSITATRKTCLHCCIRTSLSRDVGREQIHLHPHRPLPPRRAGYGRGGRGHRGETTLATRDAYAARRVVSWRAARAITYHRRGEVQRVTVVPEEDESV